ncbi:MAG: FesM [Anaerolineae bacterium]|nr:FesM [Anaerolineae bacterium]
MDLLTWPLLGRFLRWRHARTAMQLPLFLVAALIVFDGLVGPQLAPKNLATVGVWLHYRGLVVLALLLAGNLFCMACPFMLPRQAARWLRERFGRGGRVAPAWLRGKWVAVALVVLFFFCFELFDLWATPWWTAWLVVAYFLIAFAVDAVFRGAAFCKHICPVGQFNFFGSLISPLEIKVREPAVCAGCRTKDCITAGNLGYRGNSGNSCSGQPQNPRPGARGCELWLFQERKAGNMDCTFCLDCIHACPYDNIGLIGRTPTAELWTDPFRSGVGRFSQRTDLAALVAVFTFGAYLNALAMIRPIYALQEGLTRLLGATSEAPGLALIFAIGLVVIPAALLTLAGLATRALGRLRGVPLGRLIRRYVYALAPMGFGMWLAHYSFHFLTGALTIVPVVQSFLADIGLYAGAPAWGMGPLVPAEWLFPIEALLLYLGAFGSIIVAFQIAAHELSDNKATTKRRPTLGAVLAAAGPWMVLTLLLLGFGLWIMLQPMEMRGTMQMVGGG